jgi:hypothetical protein
MFLRQNMGVWAMVVMLMGFVPIGINHAQDAPPQDVSLPESAPISDELRANLDTLEAYVEDVRGWQGTTIPIYLPERDWVRDYLRASVLREYDDDTSQDLMAFYSAMGFLPADFDLQAELLNLYETQVAGFYDTELEGMVVILMSGTAPKVNLPFLERATFVHEYVHALQDARYGIEALFAQAKSTPNSVDAQRALLALIEGDATLVMNAFVAEETQRNPLGTLLSTALGGLQAGNLDLPAGFPDILRAELLFPYDAGWAFAGALYREGGWSALDQAYANPPTTSEHILHPATYLAGEGARSSETLETLFADVLGDYVPDDIVRQGTQGEFYLRMWLRQHLPNDQADAGADGWDGDAYRLWHTNEGELAWRWLIAWDSDDERNEFMHALRGWGTARFGNGALDGCWYDETTHLCFAPYEDATVLITSAPS